MALTYGMRRAAVFEETYLDYLLDGTEDALRR
jgi:hypothetical protein